MNKLYELYRQHPVVTTDSRNCPEGSIFIALKGASFDGNKFAQMALEKGCAYAVVDEPQYATDERCILVPDALVAYKELAREHRRQFNIPVIGITGTNGKTTTKELISTVLARKYKVHHTEANYNNDVGVPRTLLGLSQEHEIAVIEMGASHPGDIKKLVEYVEPTCGIITNVGLAHLQGFGSFEGVVHTKGELYDFLRHRKENTIFINRSNPHLMGILGEGLSPVYYAHDGEDAVGLVRGEVIDCAPMLRFRWHLSDGEWHEVQTQLIGAYNLDNMLAAITIGLHFNVPAADIDAALSEYKPTNNRSQLTITNDNRLIVDAYNANPTSMKAAIENFRDMKGGPKLAILGDMLELGAASHEEHQRICDLLTGCNLEEVWLVGEEFAQCQSPFQHFRNVEDVKARIAADKPHDHYILVKGSNGIHLAQLVEML